MNNSHCTHPGGPAYCKSDTCPGRARYLDFKKNSKPASDVPDVISESEYASYDTYDAIQTEVDEIFNYANEIEFPNYGDEIAAEYLTLQDLMNNPVYIRGNCDAVSSAIIENMQLDDEFKVNSVSLLYNNGQHTAIGVTSPDGENLILDFTMKQFDAEAPMPFIGKREQWENKIDAYVANIWLDNRRA